LEEEAEIKPILAMLTSPLRRLLPLPLASPVRTATVWESYAASERPRLRKPSGRALDWLKPWRKERSKCLLSRGR
jgi:hypothetical protein